MNGIRIELEIGGEREKLCFATRRKGADGEQMRLAQRLFHEHRLNAARASVMIGAVAAKADAPGVTVAELEDVDREVNALAVKAREFADQARNCAEEFVRLSLAENYGAQDIERFLANLTDAQIAQLVGVVETGSVPVDFFPSRATPPSGSTTLPPDAGLGASSSNTVSPAPISTPGT